MSKEGSSAAPLNPQQMAGEISAVKGKVSQLHESVRMSKARDALEDLQTRVSGLGQRVAGLRGRGYVFEKEMEGQAAAFVGQWEALRPSVQQQIDSQAASLTASLRPVELQMSQLSGAAGNPTAAKALLSSTQSAVGILEDKISAAERTVRGMYDQFDAQVAQFSRRLDEVEYLLTNLAQASFQLLPTEAGLAAVRAVWCKTGKEQKDDPQGVLYLTDQRLIFEQKEDVATRKVLFVATEKQKVQSLLWEAPAALVDKVNTSKKGMLKNEDHIEIRFAPGAPLEVVNLHIWRDCAAWQALINRAKARDFDQGRAVAVDQAAADRVKAAPSQCPSCGGHLDQVILRGQDRIKCGYCGFVIRL